MKTKIFITIMAALMVGMGCTKGKNDNGAAALLLLKGGAGGSGAKAQATPEAAPAAAATAVVIDAVKVPGGIGFKGQTPDRFLVAARSNSLSSAFGPRLIPTGFSRTAGSPCEPSGITYSCNLTITTPVTPQACSGGGTLSITGSGLNVVLSATYDSGTATITSTSTMSLNSGATIVYDHCTVSYNDPVANTTVTATVNGTISQLSSSTISTSSGTSSGNTVTMNFTSTTNGGPDSVTVSGFSVNGAPLSDGAYTSSIAVQGVMVASFGADQMSGTVTVTYGTPSTYTVGTTVRTFSGLTQSYSFTCSMVGAMKMCN